MEEQLETLVQFLCPIMRFILYIASGVGGVLLLLRLGNAHVLRRLTFVGALLLILLNALLGELCARLLICVAIAALALASVIVPVLFVLLLLLVPLMHYFRNLRGD